MGRGPACRVQALPRHGTSLIRKFKEHTSRATVTNEREGPASRSVPWSWDLGNEKQGQVLGIDCSGV